MSDKAAEAIAEDGLPKFDVLRFAQKVLDNGPFAVDINARDVVAIAQVIRDLDEAACQAVLFMTKINTLADNPRSVPSRFDCMRELIALERALIKIGYMEERNAHSISA